MNLSSPVRVAVIGVGSLGQHHARLYSDIPEAELVVVVDTQRERAAAVSERHGCGFCEDFREVIGRVDAVSLAVPTTLHAELGTVLLEQGVHVLVEKPIASDLGGADALIAAARRTASVLQVGHSERFNPAFEAVRNIVGEPQFFESHRLGVFVPRSLDIDVVLDLMIHDLDLILHVVRKPIREIRAVGIPVLTPRVDIANARIEFEGGCVANITASRVSRDKIRKLRFFQPHDYVSIDFNSRDVEVFSLTEIQGRPQIVRRDLQVGSREPLRGEIETFLRTVQFPDEPTLACSGPEGREALGLALRIIGEMECGRGVS